MNWLFYIQLIATLIVALIGAFLGHWLAQKRDLKNKRREIRINYLIDAYRKIERGVMPKAQNYDHGSFESAIADIQLLGSVEQVKITHDFAEKNQKLGGGGNIDDLLDDLRKELREELLIKSTNLKNIRPFRIII